MPPKKKKELVRFRPRLHERRRQNRFASKRVGFEISRKRQAQHENGDLRKIKVCVNLRKVGHPTLRNFPRRVKVCKGKFTRSALKGFVKLA